MIRLGEHLARTSLRVLQGYGRRSISTSVGRVHILELKGRGHLPPIVLLHGLASAGVHYLRVLRHLKGASQVLLPDLPGHGFSDTPAPLSGANLLAGLFEALDKVLDRPAVFAGNSLGGYTAIRYALARPEKVAGLLLAAPAGAAMDEVQMKALRAKFKLSSHREALAFADALFARRKRMRHLYAVGLRQYFRLPQTLAVLEAMDPTQLFTAAQLQSLKMPILLLWGGAERILTAEDLKFFEAHLPPHAKIERPPGWGHSGFLDDPEGFAERLVKFAKSIGPGASGPRR